MDFLTKIVDKEVLAACEPFCGKYGIEFHTTAGLQLRNKYKLWEMATETTFLPRFLIN